MTATLALEADYRRARRIGGGQRMLAWLAILCLHVSALAAVMAMPTEAKPPAPEPEAMMVRFITEAVRPPKPPPAQPPPPPRPAPKLVASARPTPAAIAAAPEPEPTEPLASPEPPAPPAPAPAPEAPAEPLVPPGFVAAYLNNPGPKYPYLSRQRREEGEVLLKVLVGVEGRAREVRVERSSGSERLDAAAIEVVQARWRFEPARRGSAAVEAWVLVPIIFQLRK